MLTVIAEWGPVIIISLAIGVGIGWIIWSGRARSLEAENRELEKSFGKTEKAMARKNEQLDAKQIELDKLVFAFDEMRSKVTDSEAELNAATHTIEVLEDQILKLEKAAQQSTDVMAGSDMSDEPITFVRRKDSSMQERFLFGEENDEMSIDQLDDTDDNFEVHLAKFSEGMEMDYVDDLKKIKGVGPKMERILHDLGVKTFYQLSRFDEEGIYALSERIDMFPGRIQRDNWIGQAKELHVELHGD